MSNSDLSALEISIVACHTCGKPGYFEMGKAAHCVRCGTRLHARKPDSINRTWALVIAAIIFYLPANIYPIMTVIRFGEGEPDTIISGVAALTAAGLWPLALLVFFASIMVPVIKLLALILLLLSVQFNSNYRPRDRTVLYRVTESVGRWSMIDIFMISILVALVRLGNIATIEPGLGAISFAAVVVLTMLAALSFDPRLIWDRIDGHATTEHGYVDGK